MLALQKGHTPIKSQVLSTRLEVSDSYLKKILRKLVVAELVNSSASKDGGFTLGCDITAVSLLDVCTAVDATDQLIMPELNLANRVFPGDEVHIAQSQEIVNHAFSDAQSAFNTELAQVKLSSLLERSSFQHGVVDWATLI
ncbi:Rrf2 family transcriptional regulator [Companilactobacillus keshanensis]